MRDSRPVLFGMPGGTATVLQGVRAAGCGEQCVKSTFRLATMTCHYNGTSHLTTWNCVLSEFRQLAPSRHFLQQPGAISSYDLRWERYSRSGPVVLGFCSSEHRALLSAHVTTHLTAQDTGRVGSDVGEIRL